MEENGVRDDIGARVRTIRQRIQEAAVRAGRSPDTVRLIAASKFVPLERMTEAVEAGLREFGESRMQEALPKLEAFRDQPMLTWHFIGRLQRRKVKTAIGRFQLIHSVDTVELAREIDRRAGEAGISQRVLLEVNIGKEPSKAGFPPEQTVEVLELIDAMPHVSVEGLMTIPPQTDDRDKTRAYYRELRELAERASRRSFRRVRLGALSMGMSADYDIAVEEGATMVRLGTAVFGERPE